MKPPLSVLIIVRNHRIYSQQCVFCVQNVYFSINQNIFIKHKSFRKKVLISYEFFTILFWSVWLNVVHKANWKKCLEVTNCIQNLYHQVCFLFWYMYLVKIKWHTDINVFVCIPWVTSAGFVFAITCKSNLLSCHQVKVITTIYRKGHFKKEPAY